MADNLIGCDSGTDDIIQFTAFTSTEIQSFASPDAAVQGVSMDASGNLVSAGNIDKKAVQHLLISATETTDFATPGSNVVDVSRDDNYTYTGTSTEDLFYQLVGFSAVENDSIASATTAPQGLEIGGGDLYNNDTTDDLNRKNIGFTVVEDDNFSTLNNNPTGCGWDGTNFIETESLTDRYIRYVGFTAVEDTFFIRASFPSGATWENYSARVGNGNGAQNAIFFGCNF
jgi:hypothetical protein